MATRSKSKTPTRVIKKYPTARNRKEPVKLWNDGSLLRRMYKEEGMSQGEIADQLGCSLVTINKAFKAAGIKVARGRRSKAVIAAGSRKVAKVKAAAATLPETTHVPIPKDPLVVFERLNPEARAALKTVLRSLIRRL